MADRVTAPVPSNGSDAVAPASASIVGECVLKLTHSTTYEPPLYLFPELLPQVPQGTPPLPVWDAVADAVDISASSWRLADASQLLAAGAAAAASAGSQAEPTAQPRTPQAMVTLTSMVADNRLLAAGVDATALQVGSFSSAAIIQQLGTLQARMGLTDEEGAAIMSNHFINLLAWQKLREINGGGGSGSSDLVASSRNSNESSSGSDGKGLSSSAAPPSRKRARATAAAAVEACMSGGSSGGSAWLPSPSPWATDADLAAVAGGPDCFVAASERNVEDRVELLHTLAELYRRPWRTLASCGQQTDFVVPPGEVNVTSPYADNSKLPGAMLDPVKDLGWGLADTGATATFFGSLRIAHKPCFFSVVVSSRSSSGTAAPQRVALSKRVTQFGLDAGVQPAAAVAAAAAVLIDVGLRSHAAHPEVLSRLQLSLVLRPVYDHAAVLHPSSAESPRVSKQEPLDDEEEEADEEEDSSSTSPTRARESAVVHTKTPDHYTLWLVNHARNGARIAGRGWVLGEPRELCDGDVLVLGDDVELRIEHHTTAAAASAAVVSVSNGAMADGGSTPASQVKRERVDDE